MESMIKVLECQLKSLEEEMERSKRNYDLHGYYHTGSYFVYAKAREKYDGFLSALNIVKDFKND